LNQETIDRVALSIRMLTLDAIDAAHSGHPGLPLGLPEWGALLYGEILKHCPEVPDWPDRDRFVLSAGHGSMLLYALLHLAGYDLSLDDIKAFRQLGSRTPGHPEHGETPGVETSTGPLGQGFGNAVGMAIAERFLAATFNTSSHSVVDHYTYALAGDGDMMEGVSSEAASLAGALGLGKLIVFYDSNRVTIDGPADLAFQEDVPARFRAYGWHTCQADAYSSSEILSSVEQSRSIADRPSLVLLRSTIGKTSPKYAGTAAAHGSQFDADEIALIKKNHGLGGTRFHVDAEAVAYFRGQRERWLDRYEAWRTTFAEWSRTNPERRRLWELFFHRDGEDGEIAGLPVFEAGSGVPTRVAGGQVLDVLLGARQNLFGGCADLTVPCFGRVPGVPVHDRTNPGGRYLYYGVREHAMGAISNGLALHGGLRAYCATFMVFSDYMRPAIRMAALMKLPVIYVMTHDSVMIGQDGPTHQPVEHLAALRAIPGLTVLRPADAEEVVEAWLMAIDNMEGPTVIVLTRQEVSISGKPEARWRGDIRRGAYVIRESTGDPNLVIVATGSEVPLALDGADRVGRDDIRVVSMISRELFLKNAGEDARYRTSILGSGGPLIVVEAGVAQGWHELYTPGQPVISVSRFGVSGPGEEVYEYLGLGVQRIVEEIRDRLEGE
jgi:transketolase